MDILEKHKGRNQESDGQGKLPNDFLINKFPLFSHSFNIATLLCIFFVCCLIIESDESPGIYLREDRVFTELRAPTAERAALFLDAALAGRTSSIYEPALIFTLHVYQYSLGAGKGGGEYLVHENCLFGTKS